ncbi:MAG: DUF1003 domain-containing protein [Chlorobia bacterium]|nr:DUF1003 domain-containing protein [Fimbriimonadaceae bacterium]
MSQDSGNGQCSRIIEENIELLHNHEQKKLDRLPWHQKLAVRITNGIGSMTSVCIHAFFFTFWILANVGALGFKPFDPFPFGLLTMVLSIEAIFLSLFVLIAQNRMQIESDNRAELDVQINLLTEHELTRLIRLADLIADKLGVDKSKDPDLAELEEDINPEAVISQIERRQEQKKT